MQHEAASDHTAQEFLRPRQAADFLNISYSHLRALMRRGEAPPSAPLGKVRVFSVITLRAWMKARELS